MRLKDQVVQAGNQVVGNGNAQANPNAPLPINGATTGPQVETRGGINWVNPSDMPTTDRQGECSTRYWCKWCRNRFSQNLR